MVLENKGSEYRHNKKAEWLIKYEDVSLMRAKLFLIMISLGCLLIGNSVTWADWTYTVQRGDSLYTIAKKCGIDVNQLKSRNGLSSNNIKIGQKLTIPTGTTSQASTVSRSSGDIDLLARVIQAEAGAEPYLGKVAVGGVIMNRIQNSKFPNTMAGVVYQPHAFESVSNGTIYNPVSSDSHKAARDSMGGWDPSGGALYFFNPAKTNHPWIWARTIINRIGKHVFAI